MLTQGRSYRVASHLATQARAQIGMGSGRDGKSFIELVSTNARNKIIYPGVSFEDAKYYSDEFGTYTKQTLQTSTRGNTLFQTIFNTQTTEQIKEEDKARFEPVDIIDRPFGQVTYRLIYKNSVSEPGVSQISYIPKDINDTLDIMIAEDNANRLQGSAILDYNKSVSADDNILSGNQFMHENSLKPTNTNPVFIDPIMQNQQEQIIQQKHEDAVYQEQQPIPMDFGADFGNYDFSNLNISNERKEEIKTTSIPSPNISQPNVVGPRILERKPMVKARSADDLFDTPISSNNTPPAIKPLTPNSIPQPKPIQPSVAPIPAHTKQREEKPPVPTINNIVRDDDI